MNLVSDDSRILLPMFSTYICGKNRRKNLESSEIKFMKLPAYNFDVDHVAKIRSELSITVL